MIKKKYPINGIIVSKVDCNVVKITIQSYLYININVIYINILYIYYINIHISVHNIYQPDNF